MQTQGTTEPLSTSKWALFQRPGCMATALTPETWELPGEGRAKVSGPEEARARDESRARSGCDVRGGIKRDQTVVGGKPREEIRGGRPSQKAAGLLEALRSSEVPFVPSEQA